MYQVWKWRGLSIFGNNLRCAWLKELNTSGDINVLICCWDSQMTLKVLETTKVEICLRMGLIRQIDFDASEG